MGDGRGDLLGRGADVDDVQDRTEPRHGKRQLEETVRIPPEGRDTIAGRDFQADQGVGELRDALADVGVAVAEDRVPVPRDDFVVRMVLGGMTQDARNEQRDVHHQPR